MKKFATKLICMAAFLLFAADVMAQVPQGFNFQAVARNADGDLIANTELGVQVSVLQGAEDGTAVYTEVQNPTTSPVGSFQIVIGEGTSEDDFSAIDWSSDNYYVKLEIDPAGGEEYEELGTTRLLSVPYALVAQDVVNGGGSGSGSLITDIELNTTEGDTSFNVKATGTEGLTSIRGTAETDGQNTGVAGLAVSEASNDNNMFGVYGDAGGAGTGLHLGVYGSAVNPEATGGARHGVWGQARSRAKYNYGTYGYAGGEGNGDEGEGYGVGSINFGSYGYATGNTWNNTGMEGHASGDVGQVGYGLAGLSNAGSTDSTKNYGVSGRAYGPGINYGVYGSAWDGVENYAGFFDGDVNINGNLTVNGEPLASEGISELNDVTRIQLRNSEGRRAAQFGTNQTGNGNLYYYNENDQNIGWFGTNARGGFMQLVGYAEDETFTGATLTGMASWNDNLPYFYMEGSSEDPFVQLVNFGGRKNDNGNEVPYFELQTTQRGIDGKGALFNIAVSNDQNGNDPEGEAAEVFLNGHTSPNVQLGGQIWEDADLGFLQLWGSTEDGNGWYLNNAFLGVASNGTDEWASLSLLKTNISGQTSQEMINLDGESGNIISNGGSLIVSGDTNQDQYTQISAGSISGGQESYTDGFVLNHDSNGGSLLEMYAGGDQTINISGNSGTITATSVNQTSDRRLKTNIKTLEEGLEKTLQMRGVTYNWKDEKRSSEQQTGLIAQEVEKVFPEFVHTDEDGMKSVNYAQMTAVLIEAVKELNTRINSLENEKEALTAQLNKQSELEQRIAQIEALLGARSNVTAE